jgi:oligopeptide transport system substrate-binding protein
VPCCRSSLLLLSACGSEQNDPYPRAERGRNILYAAFTDRPKHLDPVQSYTEDEITFTAQIYEPPLQYHYLKRPYTLIPLTSEAVPVPRYYDARAASCRPMRRLAAIAHSVYEIRIRPGIRYQPHPAFASDAAGQPRYRARSIASSCAASRRSPISRRPARANWSPTTISTRSSAWRIRACIRRSSA